MTAFTTVMTGVSDVDDSIVLAFDQAFIVAAGQDANLDQIVTVQKEINAKSIQFPIYSRLGVSTTALTETDDPASVALVDAPVLITPKEYGTVVTTTNLAALQTAGKINLAAATLVGVNLRSTQDALIVKTLDTIGSGNKLSVGDTAVSSLASTDIATRAFVNRFYNKLARAGVAKMPGDAYVMIAHDDIINDLRNDTNAGSWQDVSKYSSAMAVLANEVGMIAGFRVIRNNYATITADAGAGAVDTYNSYFLGFNALGKAVSQEPQQMITGARDKLNRFVNFGWYGVFDYALVDSAASWMGISASSVGANS